VVLNPVRAGMVSEPQDWPLSSCSAVLGLASAPPWLDTAWLLAQFGRRRGTARKAYRRFLMEGEGVPGPLAQTRHQLLLGDDAFVARFKADPKSNELRELSKAHKRTLARSLDEYRRRHRNRDQAIAEAYRSGAYTMAEIGVFFGVHYMTVSRAVKKYERRTGE